jgi:hypothetical protein
MWKVWVRGVLHIEFWWENLWRKDHFENLAVDERVILK